MTERSLSIKSGLALLASLMVAGCSSTYTVVAPTPPENYEVVGPTKGSSTGSLGIIGTAYNVVPMGLNSRVERAYLDALANAPDATGLIDVTYQESWFWWFIGTGRTVTITGTAIKEISE